jgi:ParB family chromosome partitioning protein
VGEQPAPARKRAGKAPVAPGLKDLADRLSDVFETRVKVELGQRKGKIVVEFASLDDLERIVRSMSPDLVHTRGT